MCVSYVSPSLLDDIHYFAELNPGVDTKLKIPLTGACRNIAYDTPP